MAKGELARQILNFKETEAGERRAVRGRQVLYLFDQHFKTKEEVGSLYSVEDLLKVNLLQDDLSTFIHNWESVVAGMSHVPDERTLRDILLRQIRRSARMKWDLDLYDRAKEGTSTQEGRYSPPIGRPWKTTIHGQQCLFQVKIKFPGIPKKVHSPQGCLLRLPEGKVH